MHRMLITLKMDLLGPISGHIVKFISLSDLVTIHVNLSTGLKTKKNLRKLQMIP